eukprot:m.258479 g.258479  ORF g.258479 m.258479 type:complete len:174 (+) comp36628_c0_seq1:436-957(+)
MSFSVHTTNSVVAANNLRFVITDRPSPKSLVDFVERLQKAGVTKVVRVCEPTYEKGILEAKGITVHDLGYPDGGNPSDEIIEKWLKLCKETFFPAEKTASQTEGRIAVHCVAGLGRAPVMVALALIESGMEALQAITLIRAERKGAINNRQLMFLKDYKKKGAFGKKKGGWFW